MAVEKIKTFVASLALAGGCNAMACPPPPPPPANMTAEEAAAYRRAKEDKARKQDQADEQRTLRATGIAYIVVNRTIGDIKKGHYAGGIVKIIHVYRGTLEKGKKIKIASVGTYTPECMGLPQRAARGFYGVAAITTPTDGKPAYINHFLPPELLKKFFREGIIQSAQKPKAVSS